MNGTVRFTKMHGAGNDYIYVNTMEYHISEPEKLSRIWSSRHFGIGGDGLVLIGPSEKADFSMRIFNADGSEAMMCGNASRCVGKYVYEKGLVKKDTVSLETLSGIKILHLNVGGDGKCVESVTVDMGQPSGIRNVALDGYGFEHAVAVSMGNPHLVVFLDDIASADPASAGRELENHPMFPDRVNVEFAALVSSGQIRMKVWERGSGITLACGTGACATAVAAASLGLCPRRSKIVMDGGALDIEWSESTGNVFMTGTAETVFEGEIKI